MECDEISYGHYVITDIPIFYFIQLVMTMDGSMECCVETITAPLCTGGDENNWPGGGGREKVEKTVTIAIIFQHMHNFSPL
jgi:hypothetical protein